MKKKWLFKKIGGDKTDTISKGTIVRVIDIKEQKVSYKSQTFLKIKLDNGKIRWVPDGGFTMMIFDSIPKINSDFYFSTSYSTILKNILGDSLKGIEHQYGLKSSFNNTRFGSQSYFQQLKVFKGKSIYHGVMVFLNKEGIADSIEFLNEKTSEKNNKVPLVKQLRALELTKVLNFQAYVDNIPSISWWKSVKDYYGWLTRSIAWVIKIGILSFLLFLLFSLGRLLAGPFIQFFGYTRFLSNSSLKFVSFILIMLFTYILYAYIVLVTNQWFFIGILALATVYYWYSIYSSTIEFDRCPSCHAMYIAIDLGTTENGTSKSVSSQKEDRYVGTDTTRSGNTTLSTHNYVRLTKRTTTVYRNYTENKICRMCGHEWGIKLAEKIGSSSSYD